MSALAVIGLGGVGRALIAQAAPHFSIALVADRSGFIAGPFAAASLAAICAAKAAGQPLASLPGATAGPWHAALPAAALVADTTADETGPALAALVAAGHAVALANKKPLCGPLTTFQALTATGRLRYEATVGAGLPVVVTTRWLAQTGDAVACVEGCLSGTLGFLMTEIEAGKPFSAAVAEAKRRGWTEPDPRDDLGGVDVARKALILARTLGFPLELAAVSIEPLFPAAMAELPLAEFMAALPELDAALAERQSQAASQGRTLRYVATLTPEGATVGLRAVEKSGPLGSLQGPDNLVAWTTARYADRPLVVRGPGAGVEVTASAVLFDLLALHERL